MKRRVAWSPQLRQKSLRRPSWIKSAIWIEKFTRPSEWYMLANFSNFALFSFSSSTHEHWLEFENVIILGCKHGVNFFYKYTSCIISFLLFICKPQVLWVDHFGNDTSFLHNLDFCQFIESFNNCWIFPLIGEKQSERQQSNDGRGTTSPNSKPTRQL